MFAFAKKIISGEWKGYSGKTISHIVNIGIGGSDLGPLMVNQALKSFYKTPEILYVSNIDPINISTSIISNSKQFFRRKQA